jgi:hypothetical protein
LRDSPSLVYLLFPVLYVVRYLPLVQIYFHEIVLNLPDLVIRSTTSLVNFPKKYTSEPPLRKLHSKWGCVPPYAKNYQASSFLIQRMYIHPLREWGDQSFWVLLFNSLRERKKRLKTFLLLNIKEEKKFLCVDNWTLVT